MKGVGDFTIVVDHLFKKGLHEGDPDKYVKLVWGDHENRSIEICWVKGYKEFRPIEVYSIDSEYCQDREIKEVREALLELMNNKKKLA